MKSVIKTVTAEDKIRIMAESDARFDGYTDLLAMPKERRMRYIARAERSFYALQQFLHDTFRDRLNNVLHPNRPEGMLDHLRMVAEKHSIIKNDLKS